MFLTIQKTNRILHNTHIGLYDIISKLFTITYIILGEHSCMPFKRKLERIREECVRCQTVSLTVV